MAPKLEMFIYYFDIWAKFIYLHFQLFLLKLNDGGIVIETPLLY
jgi:hypothetical protein